tara:strand:+ start:1985 stop:3121 length:1137 start_codon:yes stop_codon:yes gene_type:complete
MIKNKIYKYFTIEILKNFLIILFALSAVAWTVRAVNFLDLIVNDGHSLKTYLFYSFLNITNIFTKFIPLSFLVALVVSIIRFDRQRELLVLWSSGLEKSKILNLFLYISFGILLLQLIFSVFVTPSTLNKSRELIRTSNFDSLASIIKINDFTDSFKKMTFYIEKKNKDVLENVFIRDKANNFKNLSGSSKTSNDTIIIAKQGLIKNKKIYLDQGVIQTINSEGEVDSLYFSKTELNIDNLTPRIITAPKLQETSTLSLLSCIFKDTNYIKQTCSFAENTRENVTETLARRLVLPLYIPSVCLVACFLLSAKRKRTSNNFLKNNLIFFMGFLILVAAEILVRFSGLSDINFLIYLIAPILFTPIIYLTLKYKFLNLRN